MKKSCILGALLVAGSLVYGTTAGECASLTIDEAVNMALQNNPSVAITRYGEDTARAKLSQARGANSFSAKLSSNLTRSHTASDSSSKDGWSNDASNGLSVSLPVYSGGANQNNIKSSELGVDIAKLTTQRKWETVRYDVIKAYYNVLEAKKNVAIYQDAVNKYQKHLTNVEQLYSAGSKAKIDLIRSQVELSNSRQDLIKKQATYDNNINTLKNLLYMDQKEALELKEDFKYEAFNMDASTCVDYAMLNRKDIIVDQYTVDQKKLAVKVAKAAYLPTVDLTVSAGWDDQVYPSGNNNSVTAKVGVSWNIFDSGVNKGKVQAAVVEMKKAELDLAKAKSDAEMDVRTDYNNMREAEKRFESTKDAVRQAEEEYFIANEKYRAGEGIMLDIIDAQDSLSKAKQNYVSAQYDYARYKAAVEKDMGYDALEAAVKKSK